MKERIEFIDLAKGICILLVVQIHVFGDTSWNIFKVFSIFRMPLYFFLSGVFFKSYDGFYSFLKKKTNKLLIPFFSCFFLSIIPLHFFFDYVVGNNLFSWMDLFGANHGRFYHDINGAVWFLLALFDVNILFFIIHSVTHNNLLVVIFSVLLGFIGLSLDQCSLWLPMWVDTSLTALPFFAAGYLVKQVTNFFSNTHTDKYYLSFLFCVLCFVIIVYYINKDVLSIDFGDNHYEIDFLGLYIGGLSGVFCVMILAKIIGFIPVVSYLGRYSIVVLCTHLIYLFFIRNAFFQMGINQEKGIINCFVFLIIVLLSLPTIRFGIKYLPYFFAQKDFWK